MPWWAIGYLIVVLLLTIGAVYDDLGKENASLFVIGNLASYLFVFGFVWSFFVPEVASFLGMLVFPMLVVGIAFEFYSTHVDIEEAEDLSRNQKLAVMLVVNLIVVPGYVFGILVGIRNANV
ncbi:Uncharacterised protein [Halioglobus japonicus]|nr:Uncharacterised protein [Halioglobus japonicus]